MLTRRVWKKTEKGETELRSRAYGLAANLRRVLILIDGVSDEMQILRKGALLPDDVHSGLYELERQEYIRAETVLTAVDVKREVIRIARDTLGADAEKTVRLIEEAPDDKAGIAAALNRCKKLVRIIIDEEKAEMLCSRCAAVLDEML